MSKLTEIRSGGKALPGIRIAENLCSIVTSLNQLEDYGLTRPTTNAGAKPKDLKGNDLFERAHILREIVQRRFDKSRQERAIEYATYIEQIMAGQRLGGVPPVTLFCSEPCQYIEETSTLFLPYRSVLVNIDGETQTEARFILRDRLVQSGDWSLAAQIYHGITEVHSSQILHDVNRYAHPIRETVVAALNSEGHITKLILSVLTAKGIEPYRVNRHAPKPNPKKGELMAYRGLISAIVGAISGLSGLQNMSKEIGLLNNGEGGAMLKAAQPFLEYIVDLIVKDHSIGLTPPVVFGIYGGIAHDFNKFVSTEEWHGGAGTYAGFRAEQRGKLGALAKQAAVLTLFGLSRN
jgi:hypothetical protein